MASGIRSLVRSVLPKPIVRYISETKMKRQKAAAARENVNRSAQEVFSSIYAENTWGGRPGEFSSGKGSLGPAVDLYVATINNYIRQNQIKSVVDVGCGDYVVGNQIESIDYTGVDVVPALIASHNRKFGTEATRFVCLDAAGDGELPKGELCLIRQVLQHLSNDQALTILDKAKTFPHLIVTEHHSSDADYKVPNRDKVHGEDTRLFYGSGVYLDQPPFNLKVRLLAEYPGKPDAEDVHARGPIRTFAVTPA